MKMMKQHSKFIGKNKSSAKRKIHSTKCPDKEVGEILHYQLNNTPESSRKKKKERKKEKRKIKKQTHLSGVESGKQSNSGQKSTKWEKK